MCNVCKTVQIAPKLKLLQTLGLLIELVSINHQGLMPLKDMQILLVFCFYHMPLRYKWTLFCTDPILFKMLFLLLFILVISARGRILLVLFRRQILGVGSFQTHRQHFTLNQPTQNLKNISLYILRSKTNILCKVFMNMNNEGLLLKRTSQILQMLKRTTNAKRKWKCAGECQICIWMQIIQRIIGFSLNPKCEF